MTDYFAAAHRAQTTHGHSKRGAWSDTYKSWRYMRERVARDADYRHVYIVLRWDTFENFLEDMGVQPKGCTLDRIDNWKPYGPGNCRWATPMQQANNKTTNRLISYAGETKTLAEWARAVNINPHTLHNRLVACGWSPEKALTTPHRGWNKQGRITNTGSNT